MTEQNKPHKEIKEYIRSFFLHYAFWLCYFAVNRFLFIAYNHEEWEGFATGEVLFSFFSGILLDLSMASYFTAITYVFYLLYAITLWNVFNRMHDGIMYVFIVVGELIYLAEFPIYDEWHTKLSRKAVLYLQHPTEVYNSATNKELFGGISAILLLSALFIYIYRKQIRNGTVLTRRYWMMTGISLLAVPALLVIGIRGGLQQIPIQQSNAYFSKSNFLNLASVNSIWNLGQSFIENRYDEGTNPYTLYPDSTAQRLVSELFKVEQDSFPRILTTDKPNVVLVILESLSADMIKTMGGYDSIAPNLQQLANEGVQFTELYSSGTLSDQGHCSLLSGFPSQPSVVIMRQPDKFQKLPSIVSHFRKNGYYSAYYFGGQLEYGNIKGYIYFNQYDRIIEGKDFDPALPSGKLGYHDEFLLGRVLQETSTFGQPFFVTAFTMSSHSPYDYPGKTTYFDWGGDENMYLNGVHYSDKSIGAFMNEAKKQPWYKNTLFVFCSDHSHATPKHHNFYSPLNRKIVGFFYGEVIKPEYRGLRVTKMGNHHDLPNTLLSQLGGDVRPFVWSRNLLNPATKDFGFSADEYMNYFYDPANAYVYQYKQKEYLFRQFRSPQDSVRMFTYGSAYLQVLYDQYLGY